jgi:hypothetical protein
MTAYALAKEEKTELVLDPKNYAECPDRPVNLYWETFLGNLRPFVQWEQRPKRDNVLKEAELFVYRRLVRKHKGKTQLKGYFQSYKYFDKYRRDIQSFFELDPSTYTYINNKYKWLDLRSSKLHITPVSGNELSGPLNIAIHVRHGDYLKKGHYVLPLLYYQKCLEQIKDQLFSEIKKGRSITCVIFSDDLIWCESVLCPMINAYLNSILNLVGVTGIPSDLGEQKQITSCFVVQNEKDHIELHMLQYFDIYFLANSTFSWWGAYLNRKQDIRVFMPYLWISSDHNCPMELVYPGWTIVRY